MTTTLIEFMILALLAGATYWIARRRRKLAYSFGPCDVTAPQGSTTSARVEAFAIATIGLLLAGAIVYHNQLSGLFFRDNRLSIALTIISVLALLVIGAALLAGIASAWRGSGSLAVVIVSTAIFGLGMTVSFASRFSPLAARSMATDHRPQYSDLNVTINIGWSNVVGAELFANGVPLGKTPVTMKLSEFLAKVPDWDKPPGAASPNNPNRNANRWIEPKDPHWGMMTLPETKYLKLPKELEDELNQRDGHNIYLQVRFEGELGERTGSTGAGQSNENFSATVDFRFPQRAAKIARLLNQARLSEYRVDNGWLKSAAEFGADAWVAVRAAAEFEPGMQQVFDTWTKWEYGLNDINSPQAAWSAFERVREKAESTSKYVTLSPAGRAVELLAPQLAPDQLIDAARQVIPLISFVNYAKYPNNFGLEAFAIYAEGVPGIELPNSGGSYGTGSLPGRPMTPAEFALAHAVLLANQELIANDARPHEDNPFQAELGKSLLRADLERRAPLALQAATMLGGEGVADFLIRQANWTASDTWQTNFRDFEWVGDKQINRWLMWAARQRGRAGRDFRQWHLDQLLEIADSVAKSPAYDPVNSLAFLFTENDLGTNSIGFRYWPRFCGIVRQPPAFQSVQQQIEYLIALEPASTIEMYLDVWKSDAVLAERSGYSSAADALRFLQPLPAAKRVQVLDGLLAFYGGKRKQGPLPDDNYILRELRQRRFLEMDDEAAVNYQLRWLRDGLPEEEWPGLDRTYFFEHVNETANQRPRLIAALATAPEPEFRLLAIKAMRDCPLPQYQELLQKLLTDKDEQVRTAAGIVEDDWNSLRAPTK